MINAYLGTHRHMRSSGYSQPAPEADRKAAVYPVRLLDDAACCRTCDHNRTGVPRTKHSDAADQVRRHESAAARQVIKKVARYLENGLGSADALAGTRHGNSTWHWLRLEVHQSIDRHFRLQPGMNAECDADSDVRSMILIIRPEHRENTHANASLDFKP